MGTLTVGDVELHFEETGRGPPLVFLHGLGSGAKDWKAQLEYFGATHRCVAFDLPGSGRSNAGGLGGREPWEGGSGGVLRQEARVPVCS